MTLEDCNSSHLVATHIQITIFWRLDLWTPSCCKFESVMMYYIIGCVRIGLCRRGSLQKKSKYLLQNTLTVRGCSAILSICHARNGNQFLISWEWEPLFTYINHWWSNCCVHFFTEWHAMTNWRRYLTERNHWNESDSLLFLYAGVTWILFLVLFIFSYQYSFHEGGNGKVMAYKQRCCSHDSSSFSNTEKKKKIVWLK